ncbi:MAG: hypothetical protein Q9159_000899 [Coniocarpon cinnabarinum]
MTPFISAPPSTRLAAPFASRRSFATPTDPPRPPPDESKEPQDLSSTGSRPGSRSQDSAQSPSGAQKLPDDIDEKAAQVNASEAANPTNADPPPAIDLLAQAEEQQNSRERGDRSRDAFKTSIDRRRENVAYYGYIALPAILLAGFVTLGQSWDDREAKAHPDIPNGWSPAQVYARARTRLAETLGYYTEPAFPQLLPEVGLDVRPPYTLVLSLEDLLVSSKWSRQNGWEVAKRPGIDYFLRYLSQYYELVLFTSVPMMNAEQVYRKLDPFHFIMFPLFREGTRYINGQHVKDLNYLNRDLSKTIIIDTDPNHTQLHPENSVILPKWNGSPRDEHSPDLIALIPFLEYIAGMNIEDVRKVIKSYEGKNIPQEYARREALAREQFIKERGGRSSSSSSSGGGLGSLMGFKPPPQPGQLPGEQSLAEGLAQGKMLIDQVRERGQMQYREIQHQIEVNGQKWLEDMEAEEKMLMEEQMKSMKKDYMSFGWMFGGVGGGGGGQNQQTQRDEKR